MVRERWHVLFLFLASFSCLHWSGEAFYEAGLFFRQAALDATELPCGSVREVKPGEKYLFDSRSAILYESSQKAIYRRKREANAPVYGPLLGHSQRPVAGQPQDQLHAGPIKPHMLQNPSHDQQTHLTGPAPEQQLSGPVKSHMLQDTRHDQPGPDNMRQPASAQDQRQMQVNLKQISSVLDHMQSSSVQGQRQGPLQQNQMRPGTSGQDQHPGPQGQAQRPGVNSGQQGASRPLYPIKPQGSNRTYSVEIVDNQRPANSTLPGGREPIYGRAKGNYGHGGGKGYNHHGYGGNKHGGGGYHTSPSYNLRPITCEWTYTASPNCSLEAHVVRFKPGDIDCYKQVFSISDNRTEFKMCGYDNLYPAFRAETPVLYIKYWRQPYTHRHVFKGYVTCVGRAQRPTYDNSNAYYYNRPTTTEDPGTTTEPPSTTVASPSPSTTEPPSTTAASPSSSSSTTETPPSATGSPTSSTTTEEPYTYTTTESSSATGSPTSSTTEEPYPSTASPSTNYPSQNTPARYSKTSYPATSYTGSTYPQPSYPSSHYPLENSNYKYPEENSYPGQRYPEGSTYSGQFYPSGQNYPSQGSYSGNNYHPETSYSSYHPQSSYQGYPASQSSEHSYSGHSSVNPSPDYQPQHSYSEYPQQHNYGYSAERHYYSGPGEAPTYNSAHGVASTRLQASLRDAEVEDEIEDNIEALQEEVLTKVEDSKIQSSSAVVKAPAAAQQQQNTADAHILETGESEVEAVNPAVDEKTALEKESQKILETAAKIMDTVKAGQAETDAKDKVQGANSMDHSREIIMTFTNHAGEVQSNEQQSSVAEKNLNFAHAQNEALASLTPLSSRLHPSPYTAPVYPTQTYYPGSSPYAYSNPNNVFYRDMTSETKQSSEAIRGRSYEVEDDSPHRIGMAYQQKSPAQVPVVAQVPYSPYPVQPATIVQSGYPYTSSQSGTGVQRLSRGGYQYIVSSSTNPSVKYIVTCQLPQPYPCTPMRPSQILVQQPQPATVPVVYG